MAVPTAASLLHIHDRALRGEQPARDARRVL